MTEIPINSNDRRVQYTATEGQTVFPYDFPIFAAADIIVNQQLASDGLDSDLTITTHYTLDGVGNANGGNVTLVTGAAAGDVITVYGNITAKRTSDFGTGGDFKAQTINLDLDKIIVMIQELVRDLGRQLTLAANDADIVAESFVLPLLAARQGKLLGFDSSGNPAAFEITDASTTVITSFMATLLDDATAAAARATLDAEQANADILKADESDNLTAGYTTDDHDIGNSGTGTVTVSLTEECMQTLTVNGSFTLAPPSTAKSGVAVIEVTTDGTGGYTITTSDFTRVNGVYDNAASKVHRFIVTKIGGVSILDISEVS